MKKFDFKRVSLIGSLSALLVLLMNSFAFAAVEYSTIFSGIKTEAEDAISSVVPLAAGIFGVLAAIAVGLRIFRKVTGRV